MTTNVHKPDIFSSFSQNQVYVFYKSNHVLDDNGKWISLIPLIQWGNDSGDWKIIKIDL